MLIRLLATMATIAALWTSILPTARAEETTTNKIKDSVDDAATSGKKTARAGKRKVREATGNDNVAKDVKDKASDVGDSVSNSAKKAKRD